MPASPATSPLPGITWLGEGPWGPLRTLNVTGMPVELQAPAASIPAMESLPLGEPFSNSSGVTSDIPQAIKNLFRMRLSERGATEDFKLRLR